MNTDSAKLVIQSIFSGLFILVLCAGFYLFRNSERLFGVDPAVPSENSSSRSYSKMQVFVIWVHAFFLSGSLALLLH
jgi:hypothetical protein